MSVRIGFELEFLIRKDDYEIEQDMQDLFGEELGSKINIVTDCTIKRNANSRKRDGWFAWEIVTPPLKKKKALKVLKELYSYLNENGSQINKSTGLHINISNDRMGSIDPLTLIAASNEDEILRKFNRNKNGYCIPWSFYIKKLRNKIKRDRLISNKKEALRNCAEVLITSSADRVLVDDKHSTAIYDELIDKYMATNVSKLQFGYVEFRMIGGANYLDRLSEVIENTKHLIQSIKIATKGRNWGVINSYLFGLGDTNVKFV